MQQLPKISVITPSYNQGVYLEQTILSVLGQNYPNLEYIVIDGGSTDTSINIIKRYESKFAYWVSEKDKGQSNAINKGFDRATGDILCWLNSDDMFMPGILNDVVESLDITKAEIMTGSSIRFKETDDGLRTSSHNIISDSKQFSLEDIDFIMQPSTFWTRQAWNQVGRLNEELHYIFDWEWFYRAQQKKVNYKFTSKALSIYRIHNNQKTGTLLSDRVDEIALFYKNYAPENEAVFRYLIKNKSRFRHLPSKIIKNFIKLYDPDNADVILTRILLPLSRRIPKNKLTAVLKMI